MIPLYFQGFDIESDIMLIFAYDTSLLSKRVPCFFIFRQHAASIYGFVRAFCSFRSSKKKLGTLPIDIARLHPMVPIDLWQDSSPFG